MRVGLSAQASRRDRALSQSKTHPWLVKADEPEPESEDQEIGDRRDASSVSQIQFRGESAALQLHRPSTESQLAVVADDDHDVKSPIAPQLPLGVIPSDVHDHQQMPQQPLEAIELIPYKHQVGGHTTIWRFSRRAVCKQLNNRENEFYEIIERYHRDLLAFLPRYVVRSSSISMLRPVSLFRLQTG